MIQYRAMKKRTMLSQAEGMTISMGKKETTTFQADLVAVISAEEGNDQVFGNYQEDSLVGGPGDENLKEDDRNDHLEGGPGDDIMTGGGDGADSLIVDWELIKF